MTEERDQPASWEDPIVREVRTTREALFAAAGYDLDELCRQLRERQAAARQRVVTRAPRRPEGWAGQAA